MRTKASNHISRKCPKCLSELIPTDRTAYNDTLRFFACPNDCIIPLLWVDKPLLDGTYAQKHRTQEGHYSTHSMMNDPECDVFGLLEKRLPDLPFNTPFNWEGERPTTRKRTKLAATRTRTKPAMHPTTRSLFDGKGIPGFDGVPHPQHPDTPSMRMIERYKADRTPVFAYDEEGNITHRWHYGREEWLKI